MFEIMEAQTQDAVIKVIGVGGCGGNAVDHMIEQGVQGSNLSPSILTRRHWVAARRELSYRLAWPLPRDWAQVPNLQWGKRQRKRIANASRS